MEIILKYFENLDSEKINKLEALYKLYEEWNNKINLISRKDFPNFYTNHILHSLSIYKLFNFTDKTSFLDVGTGGGFPGIPLAIMLPDCNFTLLDSIRKKINVVKDISHKLNLYNVNCITSRAESINEKFDFITGRAVSNLPNFISIIKNNISKNNINKFSNGVLYLKGGDFDDELLCLNMKYDIFKLSEIFEEDYFETKKLVYLHY